MCSVCVQRERDRRKRRKENGICINCGSKTNGKHLKCDRCKEKEREEKRKTREFQRSLNICTRCGQRSAMLGRVLCEECSEHDAIYYRNNPDKAEERNRRRLEKLRRDRAEARETGMCICCLKRKATEGYTTCIKCRTANTRRARNRSKEKGTISYETAVYCGICSRCRKNKATHGKVCDSCYEVLIEGLEKARQTANKNHYWIEDNKLIFLANNKRKT